MRLACRGLQRMNVRFDLVLASPVRRARETAHLICGEAGLGAEPTLLDELRPGADPEGVLGAIQESTAATRAHSILVIGHMPDLVYLLRHLVGSATPAVVSFVPGGVARIDFEEAPMAGGGKLRWCMRPAEVAARAGVTR